MTKTVDTKIFWAEQPIAEAWVTISCFCKWLIGKDPFTQQLSDDIWKRFYNLGFNNISEFKSLEDFKDHILSFKEYSRIRVYTFKNPEGSEYKYWLKIVGLSHFDLAHQDEKRVGVIDNIQSNKKLQDK